MATIEVQGRAYVLGEPRKVLQQLTEWAVAQVPHPLDVLKDKVAGLPRNLQELAIKEALKQARKKLSFDSEEVQAVIRTEEGVKKALALLIEAGDASLTETAAMKVVDDCLAEKGPEYLVKTFEQLTTS